MGNSAAKIDESGRNTTNLPTNDDDDDDDEDKAVLKQLVERDDDDDVEDRDRKEVDESKANGNNWETALESQALNGTYPVIRVISNLSTTSLREVSTRRYSKVRRKRRVGSVIGGVSDASTFKIYSDTSASTKSSTHSRPTQIVEKTLSSHSSDISASDSASNSALKNFNQNRTSESENDGESSQQERGSPFPYRSIFAAFLFCLVVSGVVVVITVFFFKQNDSATVEKVANDTSGAAEKPTSSVTSFASRENGGQMAGIT